MTLAAQAGLSRDQLDETEGHSGRTGTADREKFNPELASVFVCSGAEKKTMSRLVPEVGGARMALVSTV
jgi:hypothetical protein